MTACAYPTCPKSGASCTVYSPRTGLPEAVYLCQEHWKEQRDAGLHVPPKRATRQFVPGLVNDSPVKKEPMPLPPARDLTNALADVKGGLSVNIAAAKYHVSKQRLCDACDEAGIVWRRIAPKPLPEAVKIDISVQAKPEVSAPSQVVGTSNVPDYANVADLSEASAMAARIASLESQLQTQSARDKETMAELMRERDEAMRARSAVLASDTVPATIAWEGDAVVIRVVGQRFILGVAQGCADGSSIARVTRWIGPDDLILACTNEAEAREVVRSLLAVRGIAVTE